MDQTIKKEVEQKTAMRLPMRLKMGMLPSFFILLGFVLAAIFANFIVPKDPLQIDLAHALVKPFTTVDGTTFWLGSDKLGRDILSRIILGARVSLTVVLIGVVVAGSVGTFLGILAGYKGGTVDSVISRSVDVMLGFPTILFALILAIVLGPSLFNVALVVILVYWARYARQARGETLKVREMDYTTLARTAGCSNFVIMLRHIFPNVVNSLLVVSTVNIGTVITLEATLSFLGAGVPPPAPSWGTMCADGRGLLVSAWWVSFMPGLAITIVVLSANIFGDWLRDRLDPNLRNL